jgi:hypothetical protein
MSGDESGDPALQRDGTADRVPPVDYEVRAKRDAYAAGRDIHVGDTYNLYEAPARPGRPAHAWGGVPARNPNFTGRAELLAKVRDSLTADGQVAVRALRGLGGVGKTQLATEYAHRHADSYDVVWWINAENPAAVPRQLAELAIRLGCASGRTHEADAVQAVISDLHATARWLLVYDNAENPERIAPYLPGGQGHVLITTRTTGWHDIATQIDIDVMDRADSVLLLRGRVPTLPTPDADAVACAIGDLPLAIAQAASYLDKTGMPACQYVALLKTRAAELLNEGKSPAYPSTVAAVILVAYDKLHKENRAAADVAAICAFLAPIPIPADWFPMAARKLPRHLRTHMFPDKAKKLPKRLREQASDPTAWHRLLSQLTSTGLVRRDSTGLIQHRLTQAVLRTHLHPREAASIRALAEKTVTANLPDPRVLAPAHVWGILSPHLGALNSQEGWY